MIMNNDYTSNTKNTFKVYLSLKKFDTYINNHQFYKNDDIITTIYEYDNKVHDNIYKTKGQHI